MNAKIAEISEIPAALPVGEEVEEAREKLLREAADLNEMPEGKLSNEDETDEEEELVETPRASKKKLLLVFACFLFGFVMLLLLMSWFFGIGGFYSAKPQVVDRTKQTNSKGAAPVSQDEKMQMALNLVAEKNPHGEGNEIPNQNDRSTVNSSVTVPPVKPADLNEPVVVPDPLTTPVPRINERITLPTPIVVNKVRETVKKEPVRDSIVAQTRENNNSSAGRSIFFGIEQSKPAVVKEVSVAKNETAAIYEKVGMTTNPPPSIPFGTLLPVRFLGAVYTLRASGGLVRMELTRSISGNNFAYPAGTILIGNLRGSENNRTFISVVGLIDTRTGGFVKFSGEVMGGDGASGAIGKKRQVQGTWSRIFAGIRDVGSVALGTLGSRRSGGTVIISDTSKQTTKELSGLLGDNRNPNEFVEVAAGTTAFVLVTELPGEIPAADTPGQDSKTITGLSIGELADLFTEGNKVKIRQALPKMTPQFRLLAEKYLETEER